MLRQVEELACNDAQTRWKIGMQWCSGANVDSSFLLENLFETQCVERMKSKGRKPEWKLLRCVAASLNLSLLPLAYNLCSILLRSTKKVLGSARCDVSALGWKVERKALLAILWFGFDLLYFKWVYSCDFFCDSEVCEKWINLSLFTVRPQKRAKKSLNFKNEWKKS